MSQFRFFCVNVSVAAGKTENSNCGLFKVDDGVGKGEEL